MEIRQRVREVVVEDGWSMVKVSQVPDRPGIAAAIFGKVADAGISVDIILQNASVAHTTDVSFTVRREDLPRAMAAMGEIEGSIRARGIEALDSLAKVQIVGTGILTDPAYVGRMFRALASAKVNILAIGTSEVRISCLVDAQDKDRARDALDAAFEVQRRTGAR